MPYGTQTPRLAEALQRFFGITGHLPLQVVDDVFPFVDLFRLPPEVAGLADVARWFLRVSQPPNVGQYARCRVANESDSAVVVVETLQLEQAAAGFAELLLTAAAPAGLYWAPKMLDGRFINQTIAAPNGRTDETAIGPASSDIPTAASASAAAAPIDLGPLVLMPGQSFQFTSATSNAFLAMRASGYSRPLNGLER